MNNHFIINVGRQLGSGGRIIGKLLAERFDIAFYDRELIRLAAEESGLSKDLFEDADEKVNPAHTGGLIMDYFQKNYFSNETLFQLQSEVINNIASRESAVIMGRCADYVLRDYPRCVNIFVAADMPDRIQRVMEYMHLPQDKAIALIEKTDKKRAGYYNYYSGKVWGAAASYHLCVNASVLGIEKTTDYIREFIDYKLKG
jgi:cytidylate kinase